MDTKKINVHQERSRTLLTSTRHLLDLVAKDCPLDLFDDPLPIFDAQPEPFWAGNPVRS